MTELCRWGRSLLLVAALAACSTGNGPSNEANTPPVATAPVTAPVTTPGPLEAAFGTVGVTITALDGTVCEACFWLAESADEQARGLMNVTELEGADGMAFVYDDPVSGAFWMRNTLLDLTISFHDEAGNGVGWASMVPCPDDVPDASCPRYGPDAPFVVALEVLAGDEDRLALGPDSVIELTGPCTPGEVRTG